MVHLRFPLVTLLVAGCSDDLASPVAVSWSDSARTLSPGCVGSGYTTVQSAINAAVAGDLIEVCPGTYKERLTLSNKQLTLTSRDGAASVTLDGDWLGRTLSITTGSIVIVSNLTIQNGSTTGTGGNVYCSASSLELRDSVILGGTALKGGGVGGSTCTGLAEANTISGNTATLSGGGLYTSGGAFAVESNAITGNHSNGAGGGGYLNNSTASVHGNTVTWNTSGDDGAGLYVLNGAPSIDANTFEDNDTSDEAGGLRVKLAEATITGNTFARNHADYRGGGVKVSHDEVAMSGNTYTDNTAYSYGGALFLYESASVIQGETFDDNDADYGGAVAVQNGWGNVLLEDCTFFSTHHSTNGGHLWISLPTRTTTVRRATMSGGEADNGGAIYAIGSNLTVENSILADNDGLISGGALALDGTTGKLRNSVLTRNEAPSGGALTLANGLVALKVSNTVFLDNLGGAALNVASGVAPDVKYNDFSGNFADFAGMADQIGYNGNLGAAPLFADPLNGDYGLLVGSALIDGGDPALFDTNGSRSDIGRFGGPQGY